MFDIRVGQQMIVRKHYNDDTFMEGKRDLDGWNIDDTASDVHLPGVDMCQKVGIVTDVAKVSGAWMFTVYFPYLNVTDGFYIEDLTKYHFEFLTFKYNQMWSTLNA